MKELLDFVLCRKPRLYQSILKLKGNYNFEKILFLSLIKDGNTVFDIGANRGYYTLLYSHLVGKYGEVHAFEPVPPTFNKLTQQISQKKRFDNVYLENVAIGDIEDTITLYMPDDDDGQASSIAHASGSWKNATNVTSYTCKMIRLDDYLVSQPVKRLDFIKLDVEGAELFALRGAAQTISHYSPIIYLEIFNDWIKDFNYTSSDLIKLLITLGYSEFYLVNNGLQRLIDPSLNLLPDKVSYSTNILCIGNKNNYLRITSLLNR
ncbi:MAG TPA: FkbM family methyltransferase [Leptolyngbyaceae cyanobacterium]